MRFVGRAGRLETWTSLSLSVVKSDVGIGEIEAEKKQREESGIQWWVVRMTVEGLES